MTRFGFVLFTSAALLISGNSSFAAIYDLAGQFSANNGSPWAYGYFNRSGAEILYSTYSAANPFPLQSWTDPNLRQTSQYGTPSDSFNSASYEVFTAPSLVWLPKQAVFSPGINGEIGFYRFTAPSTTSYQLSASFSGRDFIGPTNTLVSVLSGATTLYSAVVNGYAGDSTRAAFGVSPTTSYSATLSLAQGDQLYFTVGFDPNGTRRSGPFFFDTTAISATLTTDAVTPGVPEPATWAMMLVGFAGLAYAWLRRRDRRHGASIVANPQDRAGSPARP